MRVLTSGFGCPFPWHGSSIVVPGSASISYGSKSSVGGPGNSESPISSALSYSSSSYSSLLKSKSLFTIIFADAATEPTEFSAKHLKIP